MEVRRALAADMDEVGKLAGGLVRLHESFDGDRFMHLDHPEIGYARFLRSALADKDTCVLVATDGGKIVGYSYGVYEGRDYNSLLDAAGKLHDIYVAEDARGQHAGELLIHAMIAELEKMGAARVVLYTAVQNEDAQRLFARMGFRPTMLEMTRNKRA